MTKSVEDINRSLQRFFIVLGVAWVIGILALMLLWGPVMRPWTQERLGIANLAQATYDNQIRAEAARAESEAAVLRAQAISIVGKVAKEYPEYRNQEFIGGFAAALESGDIDQTLYIPTRNGVPILPSMSGVAPQENN